MICPYCKEQIEGVVFQDGEYFGIWKFGEIVPVHYICPACEKTLVTKMVQIIEENVRLKE